MKQCFSVHLPTVLFCFLSIIQSSAQGGRPFCSFNSERGFSYGQNLNVKPYLQRVAKSGDASGLFEVVEQLKDAVGIDVPLTVLIASGEDNCFATIAEGGKRLIIADHMFLVKVNRSSGTEWGAISILAHELGHHIAGFGRYGDSHQSELDADYWSGYILQKLGSSKDAATKCILHHGTEVDTDSHPNKYNRARLIRKGWDDAQKGYFDKSKCEGCN
jgi:hypothetical protein